MIYGTMNIAQECYVFKNDTWLSITKNYLRIHVHFTNKLLNIQNWNSA